MKKLLLISSLISLLSFSSTISAQAKSRFDGFYAGGELGYVKGEDKGLEFSKLSTVGKTFYQYKGYSYEASLDGASLGIFAGFNKEIKNNLIVGAEIDYSDYLDASTTTYMKQHDIVDVKYPFKTSLKESMSLRLKIGKSFNQDKTLGYLTAGFATINIERTYVDGYNFDSFAKTKRHEGFTIGAGIEHFISSKISLRAEYRYSDYGKVTIPSGEGFGSTNPHKYHERVRYYDQSLRIGVAYHF